MGSSPTFGTCYSCFPSVKVLFNRLAPRVPVKDMFGKLPKNPERALPSCLKFLKGHPLASLICLAVFLALYSIPFRLQSELADARVSIRELNSNLVAERRKMAEQTAAIEKLNAELVPCRARALELYENSDTEALRTPADQPGPLE